MTWKRAQFLLLASAFVAPLSLLAQVPASGMPTNVAGQPMSDTATRAVSQGTPGVTHASNSMQDSSMNGSVSDDTQLMKDKMFLRHATEGGLAEVQLGLLAAQKGSSDEVKKFGQRMADDHATLNSDILPIADSLGVQPPARMNKADQDEYNKLKGLSGVDFDKEYLAYMLKDHRKDLHDFHQEEVTTTDPDLKEVAQNGTRLVAGHLYLVNKLALANGVPGAYKPKTPAPAAAAATPPQ